MAAVSNCTLKLFIKDDRSPEWVAKKSVTFEVQQKAEAVNRIVFEFFKLEDPSDKALFAGAFRNVLRPDKLTYVRSDDPHISYMMQVAPESDKSLIFQIYPMLVVQPVNNPHQKIAMITDSPVAHRKVSVSLAQIDECNRADTTFIGLFNCRSFKSIIEETHSKGIHRKLEKMAIDAPFQEDYQTADLATVMQFGMEGIAEMESNR